MNKTFETSSFYLAAYLCSHGHGLVGYERDHFNRVVFEFEDSDELIKRVNDFTLGKDVKVAVYPFINGIKRLKRIIHDG